MSYSMSPHQARSIEALGHGKMTREVVKLWLARNIGDFQTIEDFRADIEDFESDWEGLESEAIFSDCMFGAEP